MRASPVGSLRSGQRRPPPVTAGQSHGRLPPGLDCRASGFTPNGGIPFRWEATGHDWRLTGLCPCSTGRLSRPTPAMAVNRVAWPCHGPVLPTLRSLASGCIPRRDAGLRWNMALPRSCNPFPGVAIPGAVWSHVRTVAVPRMSWALPHSPLPSPPDQPGGWRTNSWR